MKTGTDYLADCLKQAPHTYRQMLSYGISTSPWRRVAEWLKRNPKWKLRKTPVSEAARSASHGAS